MNSNLMKHITALLKELNNDYKFIDIQNGYIDKKLAQFALENPGDIQYLINLFKILRLKL